MNKKTSLKEMVEKSFKKDAFKATVRIIALEEAIEEIYNQTQIEELPRTYPSEVLNIDDTLSEIRSICEQFINEIQSNKR